MSSTKTPPSLLAANAPDTVSALRRGIALLRCFDESTRALTAAELAKMTGVPRPTVIRLAATLVALGLMKVDAQERYGLGPGTVSLARAFLSGLDVRSAARPLMQALSDAVAGFVYLAVPDGLEMVIIEACRPRATLMAPRLDVGSRAPLGNSALGRAYLWSLSPEPRAQRLDALRLARPGEWASLEAGLLPAMEEGDRHGWCVSLGEFHREISSIAVPFLGPGGEPMALNCGNAGFFYDPDRLRREIGPRLRETVAALVTEIGGSLPAPRTPAAVPRRRPMPSAKRATHT